MDECQLENMMKAVSLTEEEDTITVVGDNLLSKKREEQTHMLVRFYNLPPLCQSREVSSLLSEKLGYAKDVVKGAIGDCNGRSLQVRARINIRRPLKRGVKIALETNPQPGRRVETKGCKRANTLSFTTAQCHVNEGFNYDVFKGCNATFSNGRAGSPRKKFTPRVTIPKRGKPKEEKKTTSFSNSHIDAQIRNGDGEWRRFTGALKAEEGSTSLRLRAWWKVLWNLKILNKIRIFLWHASIEALPTKVGLFHTRVVSNTSNLRCLGGRESVFHALWSCPRVRFFWSNSSLKDVNVKYEQWGRNELGAVMGAVAKPVFAALRVEGAEALAFLEGFKLAQRLGARKVEIEIDSLRVVGLFHANSPPLADAGMFVLDCVHLPFVLTPISATGTKHAHEYRCPSLIG
ncbi:hypothetical protein LguiA_003186 [Lonicera macranthoides]